ncbi:DUF2071 domain-containing protein [Dyadobacter flavalbus]|uniref:DUF2071 domain-containing protein n=2 Tax=Dyadobacter flavalbus TaxID=2579942 RepID=A0A5M8QR91_9BACT|nr:DUF2071 domain-containing protein [Dyadobacter flavalbus]
MTNFLEASWKNLIMANYEIEPELLLPYIPKGTKLDFYNGKTFVSLVGFLFSDTRVFNIPIPYFGTFEEVNLRFYVTRQQGQETKRGVVFINEVVPGKIVAWLANHLYKEHYKSMPTKRRWETNSRVKKIGYEWKTGKDWNKIYVEAEAVTSEIATASFEEFILEHYYGYTKINDTATEEYTVNHIRWMVNQVNYYEIKCDFEFMYGPEFNILNKVEPHSVFLAEGSEVSVKWERKRF